MRSNAATNSGMFETVTFTRISGGACGSVAMCFAASFAVMDCRHTVAHEKKNRCLGSAGKLAGAASGLAFGAVSAPFVGGRVRASARFVHARYARRSPPRSAMFSPWVNSPFTERHRHRADVTDRIPGATSEKGPETRDTHPSSCVCTVTSSACLIITAARETKSALSSGAHQSFMFPDASNLRP